MVFLFLPVVTFIGHSFAFKLHFSGGCILKGSLKNEIFGVGRGLFKPKNSKKASF